MDRPSIARLEQSASGGGCLAGTGRTQQPTRKASIPALFQSSALGPDELRSLREWLAGSASLRPNQARRLLDRALEHGQLVKEPALHWRAVKAHVAGDANWAPMGFKLILD